MGARVLVASLQTSVREEACRALAAHGYEGYPVAEATRVASELGADGVALALVDVSLVPQIGAAAGARASAPPIVLLSDAGARLTERAMRDSGAIDAIAIPFDHRALVTVVEHALVRGAQRGSGATSQLLHGGSLPGSDPSVRQLVPPSRTSSLGDEGVVDLADGELALAGSLTLIPIGAVLQLLQVENQSGVLYVRNARSQIVATLRDGTIDLVQSRGAGDEFQLGRFFVRERLVTAQEIDELVSSRMSSLDGRTAGIALLGDVLLASGKITPAQLRTALVRQSSELLYEVLRWTSGVFEFRRQAATPLAERARLGMPVATVVMEGFRRVDEWRVIEARVGRFDEIPLRDEVTIASVGADQLPKAERAMLDLVDGQRTVRELVERSEQSSFDACRTLAELFEARLVRRRAP